MKLLIDMNLSPRRVGFLNSAGIEADHWSNLGAVDAPDSQSMDFAHAKDYIILTQDLDFGIILATSNRTRPSVVQLRTDDVSPEVLGTLVLRALNQLSSDLDDGVLLTIDPNRTRLRLLPLRSSNLPAAEK